MKHLDNDLLLIFPHGTAAGFTLGCRSMGECRYDRTSEFLTCREAASERRLNYRLSQFPLDEPIPRTVLHTDSLEPQPAVSRVEADSLGTHGTTWGYAQGCRSVHACPHWRRALTTCAEARSHYLTQYFAKRRSGDGTPFPHGTPNGYVMGCRNRSECPGSDSGGTCSEARSAYVRDRARRRGVKAPVENQDALAAREAVHRLIALGYSMRSIARMTRCGKSTISTVANVTTKRISRSTHDRIMNVVMTHHRLTT